MKTRSRPLSLGLLAVSLVVLVLAVSRLGLAVAPAAPDVLRARAIELVDVRGQVRAQLDVEESGEVVFRLRDASGTIRVKIGAAEDGSGLLLLDEKTEPGVHLLAKSDGTSFTLSDGGERRVFTP
ncbi:MAG TPA: hypothetical protein VNB06_23385 [Thermoanaerobaculia bacterium]|nr:hypothetical protein [Thermoanaerobaculia bacterium]